MNFHYKITIAYDGSRYNGWQKQQNTPMTIEQTIEDAMLVCCPSMTGSSSRSKAAPVPGELRASGRTDAGVHARGQVADFFSLLQLDDSFVTQINQILPADIRILSCEQVPPSFHARLSATAKTYEYHLDLRTPPRVFGRRYCLSAAALPGATDSFDIAAMQSAARQLLGEHDFRSFTSEKNPDKSTIRTLYEITIHQDGSDLYIRYTGNGFLYNMVRILTGTLLLVGQKKLSDDAISSILNAKDRQKAGDTLPPNGLTLISVAYDS